VCQLATLLFVQCVVFSSFTMAASPRADQSAPFPQRPVRWVVPYPAGGSIDQIGRILSQKLVDIWGQQVVIDNRPGAGGRLGTQIVTEATRDGYTQLLTLNTNFTLARSLFKELPYDPIRAFSPITITASTSQLLVVNPSYSARTVRDLIALCKAKPGQLTFASSGVGGSLHLAMELFKSMAGIDVTHVAYKGGPPAALDLMAGRVDMMFFNTPAALPHVKNGKLRALGVSTAKRSALLPEVPTIAESGVPGFDTAVWYGLAVPAGTAPAIIAKTYNDVSRVLAMPEVRRILLTVGAEPLGTAPDETVRRIKAESSQWTQVLATAKLHLD
jgi:tripartite-type tricarboxylate transporter receptor subunit TctC